MAGASGLKEETMTLITRVELASKPIGELHALPRKARNAFARAGRGMSERRDALASLHLSPISKLRFDHGPRHANGQMG
jgi:hypothetical protein